MDDPFPKKINKAKGLGFILDEPFLKYPVKFYRVMHSINSYAGMYEGELIYLSSPGCLTHKGGAYGFAKQTLSKLIFMKGQK